MTEGKIIIRADRVKPITNRHPWIFSGAILKTHQAVSGEVVTVEAPDGKFLGRGYYNVKSQIQVRILTWQDEAIDLAWWQKMIGRAIDARSAYHQSSRTAYRLLHAESDFVPGLIVDRYDQWLVLQAATLFIDREKANIAQALVDAYAERGITIKGIYERSDVDVRGKEGLKASTGLLWGEEPPTTVTIEEGSIQLLVDVRQGHKTGTYLDQANNRHLVGELSKAQPNMTILNLFSYTGGFGLHAYPHAKQVINVDSSRDVLENGLSTVKANTFYEGKFDFVEADVFQYLRECDEKQLQFDMVILDPPKFASNQGQVQKAARGYKDINLYALKITKPGGYLMTYSCSGAIDRDLFQKIVFGALADSGRDAQIIQFLSASSDHPIALSFPEGEYLKGLLLRVY